MMTVASFEIVKGLTRDCYAIVFGANTFVALGIQSIMTAILNSALKLDARPQFLILGVYFSIPALLFSVMGLLLRPTVNSRRNEPSDNI